MDGNTRFFSDYGNKEPSEKGGMICCGASEYVLNYNVVFDTVDIKLAQSLAKQIRGRSPGGIPGVESMAFMHTAGKLGEQVYFVVGCSMHQQLRLSHNNPTHHWSILSC